VGNCQRRKWTGWAITSFADAETLRGFGGINHYQIIFARGHVYMTPEQRAGRWRAAIPLGDGVWDEGTEARSEGLDTNIIICNNHW
jgi:hypothetical protein